MRILGSVLLASVCALGVTFGAALAPNAGAKAATCPAAPASGAPFISVTTAPASSCLAFANSGNINGNGDPINDLGYITLDKSDDTTTGAAEGALFISSGTSGTFSINPLLVAGYTNFVLGIKTGNHNPDWAAFTLGALSGLWAIVNPAMNLSHAVLYAQLDPNPGPSPVPLPGAFLLMGTVLAGYGVSNWRRRRARGAA